MIATITSYWKYGTTYCSIEVFNSGTDTVFLGTTAQKKNDEFTNFQFLKNHSLKAFKSSSKSSTHCFLILNTDSVISKRIPITTKKEYILTTAFPGLSLEDFYYQAVEVKDGFLVSVVRKNIFEQIIEEATTSKLNIIGVNIGYSSIKKILPLFEEKNLISKSLRIQNDSNNIGEVSLMDNTSIDYVVEDHKFNSDWLLSFSGLFCYDNKVKTKANNLIERIQELEDGYFGRNFFKKVGILGVLFFFLVLFINSLFYANYSKKLNVLTENNNVNEVREKEISTRLKKLEESEAIVFGIISNGNSKSSYYLNSLTSSMPSTIILDEFQFQPLKRRVQENKPIEYEENSIQLLGESNDKMSFNNWLNELENIEWINKVTLIDYGLASKNKDEFEINIQLDSETEN